MIRIGICDDEASARSQLRLSLQTILKQDDSTFFEFSRGDGAVNWVKKHSGELDVLFLDIEMPDIDGMEAARQIREIDQTILLVFVTGYADFVFDGYAVQALDYLLKPVQQDRLNAVLHRIKTQLADQTEQFLVVKNADGLYRIAKTEILYVYSERRLLTIVTPLRTVPYYGKLDEAERELGDGFVRIHQRYLVRAEAVDQIGKSSVQIGETTLPISRSLKNQATLALAKYMMGGDSFGAL